MFQFLVSRSCCCCFFFKKNCMAYFTVKVQLKDFKATMRWQLTFNHKEQPSISVLIKKCFENIQQIYMRTRMPKCDFKAVQSNFIKITLRHFSCKFAAYFQYTFSKEYRWRATFELLNSPDFLMLIWLALQVNLGATLCFWTVDHKIGNPVPRPCWTRWKAM